MRASWYLRVLIASVPLAAASCGDDAEDGGVNCCTCLVNANCIEASEYEFCKDTLNRGDAIQFSVLRGFTCNFDECVAASQCAIPGEPDEAGASDSQPAPSSGGSYVLVVESAEYSSHDLNGIRWDLFPGDVPPDPFVTVWVDGQKIGATSVRLDTYYPSWNDSFTFHATSSTTLSIRFFDYDDASNNDLGGKYTVPDLQSLIRSGGGTLTPYGTAVNQVTLSIAPI